MENKGTVYLLCFDKPYKHARHYIGFCENGNVEKRINRHYKGNSSRLLRAVAKAGVNWEVVRTWENVTRNFERKLKNQKNAKKLCPRCSEVVRNPKTEV